MRSTSGNYFPHLDHVRALAAILVFFWHGLHRGVPTSVVPSFFPFSLFEEGWTGVSLFMTLSGYLFAKLVDGRRVLYGAFLWNRFVRLAPLLILVMIYYSVFGDFTLGDFFTGLVVPKWPGTSWSLTVEMHFYIVFPFLLIILNRKGPIALLSLLLISICLRAILWAATGEIQALAYWTIIGRIDQFVIGMAMFRISETGVFSRWKKTILMTSIFCFMWLWHMLNIRGGFFESPLWIVLPAFEGVVWGCAIASYDLVRCNLPDFLEKFLRRTGEVSYSIYLLHWIILTDLIPKIITFPSNLFHATIVMIFIFGIVLVISIISFELVEKPFMKYRTKYIVS